MSKNVRNPPISKKPTTHVPVAVNMSGLVSEQISIDYDDAYYEFYLKNNNSIIELFYKHHFIVDCENAMNHHNHQTNYHTLYEMNPTRAMLNEMRHLNYDESQKINKLRMGYVRKPGESPVLCACDSTTIESMDHIILDCKDDLRVQNRTLLIQQLIDIDSDFEDAQYNNNIDYLLFPHLKYEYSQINNIDNILNRVQILRSTLYYCRFQFPD